MPKQARRDPATAASRKKRSAVSTDPTDLSPRASTSKATLDGDDRFTELLQLSDADSGAEGTVEAVDMQRNDGNSHRRSPSPASSGRDKDNDVELDEHELLARTTLPDHLLPRALVSGKKAKQPGLVYLSRLPPGMGPAQVRHLMSAYGEIGRIYLELADKEKGKQRKHKEGRHTSHNFKEGWVEFMDKRVARSVAEMLNAQPIGQNKRWKDDVWTMKYLPRFRWDQLSEQVALERATQSSLLRFHLTHSKQENESYLAAVENARVGRKIQEKAAGRQASKGTAAAAPQAAGTKRQRDYRQREVVDVSKKLKRSEGDLDSVLGRLF
ncbi:hypothetical protein JCM10908_003689 [Rhodotorula pacifica]|uniref:RNA-binding ATPase activator ESF2 n=1 Tax=Rhodotorula pacifica TaxID=1495444 RepID=UPI00317F604D